MQIETACSASGLKVSLALRDGETGKYILNGNQMLMTQEVDVEYGPMIIKYSGSNAQTEWISAKKLHKDLVVEVLSIKNLSPPDITYHYVIRKDAAPRYVVLNKYFALWHENCTLSIISLSFYSHSCVFTCFNMLRLNCILINRLHVHQLK